MPEKIPIVCTLSEAELPRRLAGARELGASALVGLEVAGPRALLRFEGGRESVDAFVAAESECCAFFGFEVSQEGEQVELEIRTPEGSESILRGLVAGVVAGWQGDFG